MRVTYIEMSRLTDTGRIETSVIDAGHDAAVFYSPRWERLVVQGPQINIAYERVVSVSIDREEDMD